MKMKGKRCLDADGRDFIRTVLKTNYAHGKEE